MPEEVAPLRPLLVDARPLGGGPPRTIAGQLGGAPVVVAVTGDGERNARVGLATLLAAVPVRRLLVVGVAGALSPELAAGDLLVASRVVHEDGTAADADPELVALAARAAGARPAVLVTAGRIADTADEKRRLLGLAGAGASAAAVDLESAAYAGAAARAEIPWLVLRAVSDTAAEALPGLLNRSRDDGGAVRRGRVLRGLIADPAALPILLGLGRRVRRCADLLARGAQEIMLQATS
jgi:adenosylhomocysteine nucleosidase